MPIDGWDHLEIWVGNAKQSAYFYENAYGFTRTAYAGPETGVRDRASYVLEQGDIRLVLTSGLRADSEICTLGGDEGRQRPRRRARRPRRRRTRTGRRSSAVRAVSSSRTGSRTTMAASSSRRSRPTATTSTRSSTAREYAGAVPARATSRSRPTAGRRAASASSRSTTSSATSSSAGWTSGSSSTSGCSASRELTHFSDEDISTEYSALMSKVMTDGEGKIKFPINEPAEGKRKSQIEEYLEFYGGPGVQHIALQSDDIVAHGRRAPRARRALPRDAGDLLRHVQRAGRRDRRELGRPRARWASSPTATRRATCCRSSRSPSQDRPTLFFEVIERHGSRGFGKGNFKALFEAIEREQALRGNL